MKTVDYRKFKRINGEQKKSKEHSQIRVLFSIKKQTPSFCETGFDLKMTKIILLYFDQFA
jgi:hypothetical protein